MKKAWLVVIPVVAISLLIGADFYSDANFKFAVSTDGPWVDSMVPGMAFRLGASAPALDDFTDSDIKVLSYAKDADNLAYATLQLNHNYKEGTDIYPHIHVFYPIAAVSTAETNVWSLSYSWGDIAGVFPASTTVIVTNSGAIAEFEHRIIQFGAIDGTGMNISSVLAVTIQRTGTDDYDVYDDTIGFLGFDVHYQVDALGSTTATSK